MRIKIKSRWLKAGSLVVATVLAMTSLSGSAQAAETGTISGTFIDRAGVGMPNVSVTLQPAGPGQYIYGMTDSNGDYSIANVPLGQYRVRFQAFGYPWQYAYSTTDINAAQNLTVTAGSAFDIDDQLMPTGTFTGRLTRGDGAPLAYTSVYFSGQGAEHQSKYSYGQTDADGYYTTRVHPGTYRISFWLQEGVGNSLTQYIPGADVYDQAQLFPVAVDETKVVNDTLMPNGYITGTFRDANGTPMQNVNVTGKRGDTAYGTGFGNTDSTGQYRMRVKAGQYKVYFNSWEKGVYQYAYGQTHESNAAIITVQDGQTTTVNDNRLATGSVKVTGRDAVSGALLNDFWASLSPNVGRSDNNDDDGMAIISEVPAGTYTVYASAHGYHDKENAGQVTVTVGQQTSIEVTLERRARFDAIVVDAQTGAPIEGVCLTAGTMDSFKTPDGCQPSSADGRVMEVLWWDKPGTYQLMAFPYEEEADGFGAQWVGPNGGVGSQLEAKSFNVRSGDVIDVGVIRMDRAGTITGKVTPSSGTGSPTWGSVMIADQSWRAGGGYGSVGLDAQGNYTIDFLGPYAWPLRFGALDEAVQWSGGKGNRHEASRVQVTSGATTTFNYQFTPGVTVDINVPFTEGYCDLEAYNAATGDQIGGAWDPECITNGLQLNVVSGQEIKLAMYYDDGSENSTYVWHGGKDFKRAMKVPVTGAMELTFQRGAFETPRMDPPPATPTPVPVPRPTGTPPSSPPVPRL